VHAIEAALARPARRLRVLVTSGGTAEPIDGVRVLTNTSTGRTGAGLAAYFGGRGHEVCLLRARGAMSPATGCREETFFTFADLDAALARLLGAEHFDAVVHAAAVGDFGIEEVLVDGRAVRPGGTKLESGSTPVTLRLHPNPKLVDSLRARSRNPDLRVVAFKLTNGAAAAAVRAAVENLFEHSGAGLVVHNDLAEQSAGGVFPARLYRALCHPAGACSAAGAMAP
jgi:phosphopantothenoylcysteine synthetase/decarboxylase